METICFICDKNLESILCCLFYSFTENKIPIVIADGKTFQASFDAEIIKIGYNRSEAERVRTALIKYSGKNVITSLSDCLLSGSDNAALITFNYARRILEKKRDISGALSDKAVSDFFFELQKVYRERHRIYGFLRFIETESGVLYAPYSPDNDITALIGPHFLSRLACPFVIHDIKRGTVTISDGKNIKTVNTDLVAEIKLSENEKVFQSLFKSYYREISIKERKNKRLQDNCMPLRYRKFMTETYED